MRVALWIGIVGCVCIGHAQAATSEKISGSFGGVQIKEQSREAAARLIHQKLDARLDYRIKLALGRNIVSRRRRDLGFSVDVGRMFVRAERDKKKVPILFAVNEAVAISALKRLQNELDSSAREARPVRMGNRVKIRPEQTGQSLNVGGSAVMLKKETEAEATKTRFELRGKTLKPRVTRESLKGVNAVLSTFTTRLNPGQVKRTHNVRLGVRAIDGTLLPENGVFSLNDTVGQRTQARGYRTAIIFENGRKVPGLGGGISQVTGTLFNAALVAGLPIVFYRTHSRPVAYLPLGRDATVSWGNFDMKFKNDTKGPIFISYRLSGSRLSATLFGHYTGRKARVSVTSHRNGPRDISAKLYRVIRQEGKVIKREKVGSSHYDWKKDEDD